MNELHFNTVNKTITVVSGRPNLQELYILAREMWCLSSELMKYKFPFYSLGFNALEVVNGWSIDESQLDMSPVKPMLIHEVE